MGTSLRLDCVGGRLTKGCVIPQQFITIVMFIVYSQLNDQHHHNIIILTLKNTKQALFLYLLLVENVTKTQSALQLSLFVQ